MSSQAPILKFFPKGTILQRQGDLDTQVYSVRKGLLRSYLIDPKGKEHIFMFAPQGWIIADSNPVDEPAQLFIDTLEDSEVVVLEKDLNRKGAEVAPLLRRISVLQNRVMMLMSASAIERYEHFCEMYPNILQRVPQKMIASYLGITPEALSKLKRSKSKSL